MMPGHPWVVDERWVEIDYGELDGEPLDAVPAQVWRRWRLDRHFRPPGGETVAEVEARVADACRELFSTAGAGARSAEADVVVVSHVSPIKAAVGWALGVDGLHWRMHLSTGSVTRIGWEHDSPILFGYNQVALASGAGGTPQSARA
jgi:broad specificity phosphatase PhoE